MGIIINNQIIQENDFANIVNMGQEIKPPNDSPSRAVGINEEISDTCSRPC